MDKFDKAEEDGRKILEQIISGRCINYEFTKNKYQNVDLFVTGRTDKAVIEIKNRTAYTSTDIDKIGGHMLEWHKYTALTSYDGYKPIYTMIYPDMTLMWDVSKINEDRFVYEENKYKTTTVVEGTITPKKVAYLTKDEAVTKIPRKNEQDSGQDSKGQDS